MPYQKLMASHSYSISPKLQCFVIKKHTKCTNEDQKAEHNGLSKLNHKQWHIYCSVQVFTKSNDWRNK